MPFRSRGLLGVVAIAVLAVVPFAAVLGSLRTSSQIIVTADDVVAEDLIAVGGRTIIEGVVEGDLVVVTGRLTITGTVEGDVVGLVGGTARLEGTIGGSVRLAAVEITSTAEVGDDLAALAVRADVGGMVGRDVLITVGEGDLSGGVGRDVRGQVWRLDVDGEVGRDVLVRTDRLTAGPATSIAGDLSYRAGDEADLDPAARVGGQVVRRRVLAPVWAKAVTRAFAVLSLLGFLVAGLALLWLFRGTTPRAVELVAERPGRAAAVGTGVLLLPPLAVVPLFATLVGIPLALILLVAWLVGLFLGPMPTVAYLGRRLLPRRGLVAGFVTGAVLWRGAMWLLPLVGVLFYLAALLPGLGAFTMSAWERRRASDGDWRPLPPT